ncbi:insulinoma-associated protein 2 [Stigmatopora nigra]
MPRGFLVKRTRRGSASHRPRNSKPLAQWHDGQSRCGETEPVKENHVWGVPSPDVAPPPAPREDSVGVTEVWNLHVESAVEAEEADRRAQLPDPEVDMTTPAGEDFSCFLSPPHPSVQARAEVEKKALLTQTCLSSSPETQLPFLVSSTRTSTRVTSPDARFSSYGPLPKYESDMATLFPPLVNPGHHAGGRKRSPPDSNKHNRVKAKVNRKLTFEDEVTTSPVLGLRIKKEGPEATRRQPRDKSSSGSQPLGEFICQLCKEEYADPLSLAQHKCSRIVRVEYRCPECDKVFSCPANLASHRRWHKPRPTGGQSPSVKQLEADGRETESLRGVNRHRAARDNNATSDSSSPLYPPDSGPPPGLFVFNAGPYEALEFGHEEEEEAELYDCRYCGKQFRRQAYLRKHTAAHEMATSSRQVAFVCHLCGARFPSADVRDKHRVWHAMRDELLGRDGGGCGFAAEGYGVNREREQQLFACKLCSAAFLSSPGLARHVSKSHPGENMHVIMHMAVTN